MVEFILARYNYWIVIVLMMIGLYIVFSRGNLIKTLIGLNLFQTSVFIYYITIGKVYNGTAPILVGGREEGHHEDEAATVSGHEASEAHAAGHAELNAHAPLSHVEAEAYVSGDMANSLPESASGHTADNAQSLHDFPDAQTASNDLFAAQEAAGSGHAALEAPHPAADIAIAPAAQPVAELGHHAASTPVADAMGAIDGVVYSNPLPHVLILTAIVVGVATTAVGLSLAVRIREAFGTIEEDALERMNNEAEFGGIETKGAAQ